MRVRTCEASDVFMMFTRVRDTCEVFVSAVAHVCVHDSGVSHVCMYTMLDGTTNMCPAPFLAEFPLKELVCVLDVK